MKDKYYVPEIEEFAWGLEYEIYWPKAREWKPQVVNQWFSFNTLEIDLEAGEYIVKYLDREGIESIGFKQGQLTYQFFDGIHMLVDLKDHKYSITHMADEQCLFYGTIKNKSELKRIVKQLGI